MEPTITEKGKEGTFVADTSGGTTNTLLAAALSAIGIPFSTRPSSIVTGDSIAGNGRITWYFEPRSACGQYSTAELINAWDDKGWHARNPEHPFAYIKCAMQNYSRLIDHLKHDVPIGLVKHRGKIALVSLNASHSLQDSIFRKL